MAGQWNDRTYDPNCQKLASTKSGYISGTEMATLNTINPTALNAPLCALGFRRLDWRTLRFGDANVKSPIRGQ